MGWMKHVSRDTHWLYFSTNARECTEHFQIERVASELGTHLKWT